MLNKMSDPDHIYNAIFEKDLGREICQMMIFRASSDKSSNKLVLESCLSPVVLSLELESYIMKLPKKDPIYKLVERAIEEINDKKRGVS